MKIAHTPNFKRLLSRSLLILPLTLLASCSGDPGQHFFSRALRTPKRAIGLDAANSSYSSFVSKTRYNYTDDNSDTDNRAYFRSAYDAATDTRRISVRNEIAKELAALIDENHAIYHDSLRKSLTTNNVFFDFLTLGLTSSGAIATGAQATRALSAIATGTMGFGGKVNGRILQEQTLSTVLKAIRIRKEQAYMRMQANFDLDANKYTLEDVILDLGRYWEAGLLASGVQQLDEMTSKTLDAVDTKKNETAGATKDKQAAAVLKAVTPKATP